MKTAIIIVGLMVTVASVNGGFMQQIPNWMQECVKKGQWKKETGQRLSTLTNLKAKDAACPLKCLGEESGVISGGKINTRELMKDLAESHKFDENTTEQLHNFAQNCAKTAESDKGPCAPAGALAECLAALLKKS